jgi:hypothetical protein
MRNGQNALTHRKITLSLTQEANENLKVAANYSNLKIVKVSAEFTRRTEQEVDVMLTAMITFPQLGAR